MSGRDYKGGSGLKRGGFLPLYSIRPFDRLRDLTPLRCLRDIDAYGVRGFGSAMPECKHSVAAFALHAIPAGSSVKSLQYWNDIPEEI